MKGFIATTLVAGGLLGVLVMASGCECYHNVVDPCYPERYEHMSRQEVQATFAPQVQNGHVLDQTVWNSYFEPGTDRLTEGGMAHLEYLARRRPCPDTVVYLQLAHDVSVAYDQEHPDRFVEARMRLDNQRCQAVQAYLMTYTTGRNQTFTVLLHDPPETGMSGVPMNVAVTKSNLSQDGVLVITGSNGIGQ